MKECPICHTRYDDSLSFCTKDGHQLRIVETSPAGTPQPGNNYNPTENRPKGKKGCLKKIVIGIVVFIIALIVFYKYLSNAATYLRTEPSEVLASKAGGTCKVDIDYDGYIWLVNHQPEWVDIDENDDDFVLSVGPNHTGQIREGSITIQSGKLLAQVVVRQNAQATVMRASNSSVKFGENGGSKDISIESDGCGWEAEYTNWMNVTKESETELHIKCPRNDGDYRTGTITVKEDNASVTISVTQAGNCNNCHGSGEVSCSSCLGMGGMGFGMYYSSCMWCGGRGKITCGLCSGSGRRE